MKMEEFIKFEHSGIFRVELVTKNVVLGSSGTHFMHMRVNNSFSRRSIIEYGITQGSVLDPLLFNIDLINLFYECEDSNIVNYANDTTPYASGENIRAVISELQSLVFRFFKWFENNHMKANPGKSHILLSKKKIEKVTINDVVLTSSVEEKLLGITLDSEHKFETSST